MIISFLGQPNAVFAAQELQKSHVQAKGMQTNIYGLAMAKKKPYTMSTQPLMDSETIVPTQGRGAGVIADTPLKLSGTCDQDL